MRESLRGSGEELIASRIRWDMTLSRGRQIWRRERANRQSGAQMGVAGVPVSRTLKVLEQNRRCGEIICVEVVCLHVDTELLKMQHRRAVPVTCLA